VDTPVTPRETRHDARPMREAGPDRAARRRAATTPGHGRPHPWSAPSRRTVTVTVPRYRGSVYQLSRLTRHTPPPKGRRYATDERQGTLRPDMRFAMSAHPSLGRMVGAQLACGMATLTTLAPPSTEKTLTRAFYSGSITAKRPPDRPMSSSIPISVSLKSRPTAAPGVQPPAP
jgi:hypothetical protein